jgi:hypothetical protein
MKHLELTPADVRLLRGMGIFDRHPRIWLPAHAMGRLRDGLTR